MTSPNVHLIAVDRRHAAALAEIKAKSDRVRYAIEHNSSAAGVPELLDWLAAHGVNPAPGESVEIGRTYAAGIAKSYREGRKVSDTADLPRLTPEIMAEIDAANAAEIIDAPVETPSPSVQTLTSASTESRTSGHADDAPGKARGTGPFYFVAVVASLISLDTSYRFFGLKLHIADTFERAALCGVVELTLIACGYAMRHNVRRPGGTAGPAQLVAAGLCGVAAFMAVTLGGPVAGTVRAALGPILALVALHLALGIEIRVRRAKASVGTLARVGREMRERMLSRLGLADDTRDALARTRDRAADRAARLATARFVIARRARLARAIRVSGVGIDAPQRARLMAQLRAQRSLDALLSMDVTSPWQ